MLNKAIIGKKVGMTQIFNADGKVIPCTVIEAGPCVVTQLKTEEKDGYNAVQFGFEDVKEARLNKPQKGLVGSEMCIRDSPEEVPEGVPF